MHNKTVFQKVVSILLCLCMVAAWLPAGIISAAAEGSASSQMSADPHTLNNWKNFFGTQTGKDHLLSTEFAGGVWTDKSVFAGNGTLPKELTDAAYNGHSIRFADTGDNFLVALSAIASNKEIKGYSTIPTDTVLVLDLSSSMRYTDNNGNSAIDNLAAATNSAISQLLELNKNNRIGVVLYAGNVNKSFSVAEGITKVLLPLDSYTPASNGKYVESTENSSGQKDYALQVVTGVKNSAGQTMSNGRMDVSTGTYIQDGIYEAMKLLYAADTTVDSGIQAGTDRIPIMVVMTDGEATMANNTYYGNFTANTAAGSLNLGNSTMHDFDNDTGRITIPGGFSSAAYEHRDTMAFLTSLTAAFAKKLIGTHYNTQPLMYTLAYGEQVVSRSEVRSVLDPVAASQVQKDLWTSFLTGDRVPVYRGNNTYQYVQNVTDAADIRHLTAEDRLYVDKYFPAGNDQAMETAFQSIVEEIILQSKYYPTLVQSDYNHDGYLTFTDKIGHYMDVVDVKGIVVGDRLFSGAALAYGFTPEGSIFGTVENPSELGDNLIWSVKERLHISDAAIARTLVDNAYNYGQMYYNSDTDFSHYIGWFADADGAYIDFWHEGVTQEEINAAVAKGATHIVRSYMFLGDTKDLEGVNATDMMYMSVRVTEEIATGNDIVIWQIPASLIPTITYEIEVELDGSGMPKTVRSLALSTGTANTPIRLLYEVALQEDVYDWNLTEKVSNEYKETTYHKDRGYVFYSNQWDAAADNTTYNAYSHFEPSQENERYYYTNDAVVYVPSGSSYVPYTGTAKPSGTGFVRQQTVYKKLANGTLTVTHAYEPISANALADTKRNAENNQWYVPKNTMQRVCAQNSTPKEVNTTQTMDKSNDPQVVYLSEYQHYYSLNTLGNNGKLVMTPATGIKLTKVLTQEVPGAANSFTFTVSGGDLSNAKVVRLDAEGNEASRTALASNGQVTLAAGETVYLIDLAPGTYTVAESAHPDYSLSSVTVDTALAGKTASVTVASQNINDVVFTNAPKGYGSLSVGKDVMYENGIIPNDNHNNKEFEIAIRFEGENADLNRITVSAAADPQHDVLHYNNKQQGEGYVIFTLHLRDEDRVTFSNIAEGITYSVLENGLVESPTVTNALPQDGYRYSHTTYYTTSQTIVADQTQHVQVVNTYAPQAAEPIVTVSGTKTVKDDWANIADATFTVKLWQVKDMGSEPVEIGSAVVSMDNPNYAFDLSSLTLEYPMDTVGMYYFRITEEIGNIVDMGYDRSVGLFTVRVDDTDADGVLEITAVTATSPDVSVAAPSGVQTDYVVDKDFTNYLGADTVLIPVQKIISGTDIPAGLVSNLRFGLFKSPTATESTYSAITDANGLATIAFAVTDDMIAAEGGELIYYLREIAPALENRHVGMTYNTDWQYAIKIIWGSGSAVVQYAQTDAAGNITGSWRNVDPTLAEAQMSVTNTYDPDVVSTPAIQLSGNKVLERPEGSKKTGSFQFDIYHTGADWVVTGDPAYTSGAVSTDPNTGAAAITFPDITFKTAGTHYLVIQERNRGTTSTDGITYDVTRYSVKVQVDKGVDNAGKTILVVSDVVIQRFGASAHVAEDAINFTNTYTVAGSTGQTVGGTKILTGRPMTTSEFRFQLMQVDASGAPVANGTVLQAHNGAASGTPSTAAFQFPELTFTEIGEYFYQITELRGGAADGVTYPDTVYTVKITVSDNGQGGLTSTKEIFIGTAPQTEISFTNTYYPRSVQVPLIGVKELLNQNNEHILPIPDGKFSFTITETQSDFATLAVPGIGTKTIQNTGSNLNFGVISFSRAGTRYFVIKEVLPADAAGTPSIFKDGVTYDATAYHVTITATDDHKGNLVADITVNCLEANPDDPSNPIVHVIDYPAFTNRYTVDSVSLPLAAVKKYDGKHMKDFNFILTLDGNQIQKKTNDAKGNIVFDDVVFTAPGTYILQLKEEQNALWNFVKWDETMYTITVTVTDNGYGKLVISQMTTKAENEDAQSISFHNGYILEKTSAQIDGTKVLEGGTLAADMFQFLLYEAADASYNITGLEPIGKVSHDAAGKFQFNGTNTPALVYTGEGTHYYVLVESAAEPMAGVRYDKTIYTFKATVTDNEEGKLIADVQCTSGQEQVVFRNVAHEEILNKDVFNVIAPEISVDGQTVMVGDILIYTIDYTNYTGKDTTVVITDVLPGATAYLDGTASHDGVYADGVLTWELTVAKGESVTVSFQVEVKEAGAPVANKATAVDDENQYYTNEVTTLTEENDATGDAMDLALCFGLLLAAALGMTTMVSQKKRFLK